MPGFFASCLSAAPPPWTAIRLTARQCKSSEPIRNAATSQCKDVRFSYDISTTFIIQGAWPRKAAWTGLSSGEGTFSQGYRPRPTSIGARRTAPGRRESLDPPSDRRRGNGPRAHGAAAETSFDPAFVPISASVRRAARPAPRYGRQPKENRMKGITDPADTRSSTTKPSLSAMVTPAMMSGSATPDAKIRYPIAASTA